MMIMCRTIAGIAASLKLLPGTVNSDSTLSIDTLLIDSRSLIGAGHTMFFAIPTRGNDGHRYMHSLYEQGVRAFVANHIPADMADATDASILLVDDTVAALQTIGAAVRRDYHGPLLSITGSRGKTTLKEWIYQLLEPLEEIARSPRSYNSQLGVPLSLWELRDDTTLGIIEAGVSQRGEMQKLAGCISPDTVIVTNIGDEHADGFTDIDEKCDQKLLLASGVGVSTVIYCADDEVVSRGMSRLMKSGRCNPSLRRITWTARDAEGCTLSVTPQQHRITYRYCDGADVISGDITLHGDTPADIENSAHALAFMLSSGMAPDIIARRFETARPVDNRMDVVEGVNDCRIVYDSYTSDTSSLASALDFMRRRSTPGDQLTVILSDPCHEGLTLKAALGRIYRDLLGSHVTRLIGIGPRFSSLAGDDIPSGIPTVETYADTDDFLSHRSPSDFSHETILLKGAPEYGFNRILETLEARKHETVLEVNLDSLKRNFNYFRSFLPDGTGLIAMVKASAYGAGSFEVARTMQDCGAAYLAVAVLDEGIELRRRGITMPIMVMNPKVVNYKSMFANRLEPEIYSREMLLDVIREAEKNGISRYPVHIKLDTGMHRMGFIEDELSQLMDLLESQDRVEARSVFTHLATADCPDMDDYTLTQLDRFRRYTDYMLSRSSHPVLRHVLNSAGIVRFPQHHYDMARLGIGLYGVNTLPPEMERPLDTVSTLRTVIIAIREWKAGETIGYGRRGVLTRDSRIATIPIGYADGMNRHFGNGAVSVRINGHDAPTIGNICMDACMIDVTDVPCKTGDSVEIFGNEASVYRLAEILGTIPYEILTSVSPRVKRIYYQ